MRYYIVMTEEGYKLVEVAAGAWHDYDAMNRDIIVGMSRSLVVAWLILNTFRANGEEMEEVQKWRKTRGSGNGHK